jgi:hypothetical protein
MNARASGNFASASSQPCLATTSTNYPDGASFIGGLLPIDDSPILLNGLIFHRQRPQELVVDDRRRVTASLTVSTPRPVASLAGVSGLADGLTVPSRRWDHAVGHGCAP